MKTPILALLYVLTLFMSYVAYPESVELFGVLSWFGGVTFVLLCQSHANDRRQDRNRDKAKPFVMDR